MGFSWRKIQIFAQHQIWLGTNMNEIDQSTEWKLDWTWKLQQRTEMEEQPDQIGIVSETPWNDMPNFLGQNHRSHDRKWTIQMLYLQFWSKLSTSKLWNWLRQWHLRLQWLTFPRILWWNRFPKLSAVWNLKIMLKFAWPSKWEGKIYSSLSTKIFPKLLNFPHGLLFGKMQFLRTSGNSEDTWKLQKCLWIESKCQILSEYALKMT